MTGMIHIGIIVGIAILVAIAVIPLERERRKRLGRYWSRSCTGSEWRKHFPDVPKEAIREFLSGFVDSFIFKKKQRLKSLFANMSETQS